MHTCESGGNTAAKPSAYDEGVCDDDGDADDDDYYVKNYGDDGVWR